MLDTGSSTGWQPLVEPRIAPEQQTRVKCNSSVLHKRSNTRSKFAALLLTCFSAVTCSSIGAAPATCFRFLMFASAGVRKLASALNDCCRVIWSASTFMVHASLVYTDCL
eukprot:scaffold291315_cov47-Attheya_sp.AAC.1